MKSHVPGAAAAVAALTLITLPAPAMAAEADDTVTPVPDNFRMAVSLTPFTGIEFDAGWTYQAGERTATTPAELGQLFLDAGGSEVFTRIGTKRVPTFEEGDFTYGQPDVNANRHTLEQGLEMARTAAELGVPLNPELMLAYTYSDVMESQAPDFHEYPQLAAMQGSTPWNDLELAEMLPILTAYGKLVAGELLDTGATIRDWNIGNESNSGFAGTSVHTQSALVPNPPGLFGMVTGADEIWALNGQQMAAVKAGVLTAYDERGLSTDDVTFSAHVATVLSLPDVTVKYFKILAQNGFAVDYAGFSFYPSAGGISTDALALLKDHVTKINAELGVPAFIAEYSYPSEPMTSGAYAGWNAKVPGFEHDEAGQAALFNEVLRWGTANGLAGIRWWGTDYVSDSWEPMSMFSQADDGRKVGLAKKVLLERLPLSAPVISAVTPDSVSGTGVPGASVVVTDADGASLCEPVLVTDQGAFSCSFAKTLTKDDLVEVTLTQSGRPASATATVAAPTPAPDAASSSWAIAGRAITLNVADQYGNQIALREGDLVEASLTATSARALAPAVGTFEATSVAGTYRAVVADDVAGRFDVRVTLNGAPVLHEDGAASLAVEFAVAPTTGGGTSSTAPGSMASGTASFSGSLASTGSDGGVVGLAVMVAVALILSGGLLTLVRRRRALATASTVSTPLR